MSVECTLKEWSNALKKAMHCTCNPYKFFTFSAKLLLAAGLLAYAYLLPLEAEAAKKYTPASLEEVMQVVKSHRGEVVILNVFASWCPPCVQEAKTLTQFYRKYPPESGIHLYGVSLDDDLNELEDFLADREINFPVYHCGQDFVDNFEIETIPTLIVFDREGTLADYHLGIASMKELTDIMDKYR